jgi:hypothetical protein
MTLHIGEWFVDILHGLRALPQIRYGPSTQERRVLMRWSLLVSATLVSFVTLDSASAAGVKSVAYPQVNVKVSEAYKPDAVFKKMQAALTEATAKKDAAGLFALIGPTFVWTVNGGLTERFDMGRDASHNFKVLFGFRAAGKDADGGVEDGPYWDVLAEFAADATYYQVTEAGNLVCGPIAAEIVDEQAFERARKKIEPDEGADWYFIMTEVAVTKAPGDTGPPIAKLSGVAVPLLNAYPPATESQPAPPATHVQILLPSGTAGWIPAAAARPLTSDRLCYAKTPIGDWKIAAFDQSGE